MNYAAHIFDGATPRWHEAPRRACFRSGTARHAGVRSRILRSSLLAVGFLLPLAVLPGLEQPFSRPKLVLWSGVVVCGILSCARQVAAVWHRLSPAFRIALAVWLGAMALSALSGDFASLDSLVLPLTGVGWFLCLLAVRPQARHLAWALVLSGSAVSAVAVAQFFHADPFSPLGWVSAWSVNSRMRVFGTLGNPDFVAAFLAGILPLTVSLAFEVRRRRWLLLGLSALQAAAILATGSRAPILALGGALLWMAGLRARRLACVLALAAVCIVALAAVASPARDLGTTLRGRFYIWKVSAAHLGEHPLLGLGPGGFGAAFPAWETQYWRGTPDERNRKFAGVEDHAHNDYLEIVADYGACGLLGFLAVFLVFLRAVRNQRKTGSIPLLTGASAGVVALGAMALVDFPLMRPAEVFLFWSLMGISLLSGFPTFVVQQSNADESTPRSTPR